MNTSLCVSFCAPFVNLENLSYKIKNMRGAPFSALLNAVLGAQ